MLRRVNQRRRFRGNDLAVQDVDFHDPIDLVAPELDAERVAAVHRVDLDGVAADPEGALLEVDVVALVVQIDEPFQESLPAHFVAGFKPHRHPLVVVRIPEPVDG